MHRSQIEPHFGLVTDAHRFLLAQDASENNRAAALAQFLTAAGMHRLPRIELDAVVVRVLRALDRQAPDRSPGLVDRYLDMTRDNLEPLSAARYCLEDTGPCRQIRNPHVREAVILFEESYADSSLTLAKVAQRIGIHTASLCRAFKAETGATPMGYLRSARLRSASARLATTAANVKEVWTAVGYNHASNFDHDFRRQFGVTPSHYRQHIGHPTRVPIAMEPRPPESDEAGSGKRLLVVDGDASLRQAYEAYLGRRGYLVATAPTGEDGLQLMSRASPDVILVEYHLPDHDGLEFLRTVRARPIERQPGVVLFTADWNLYDHSGEVFALGGRILSKLCVLEDVEFLVRELCESEARS
jgi:AraC-like DNA-binding protein